LPRVIIRVFGHVREFMPGGSDELAVDLQGPTTVRELLRQHEVAPELFMQVYIDGGRSTMDAVIDSDAELVLVSPAAGG